MESLFTKIIITLSTFWVVSIIVYAYKNDFSSEILSFFLPALGAIILSFFVGIKFIYFDAPRKPDPTKLTVAIVHDKRDNTLYGLGCNNVMLNWKTLNEPGLAALRSYNTAEIMDTNNIKLLLSKDPLGMKLGQFSENDQLIFSKTVFDFLEYNIFDWLSRINSVNGSWFNREYIYNFPSGRSQEATNLADSSMVESLTIDKTILPDNILFKTLSIECIFPTGTSIKETHINDFRRSIFINSKYSTIEFTIQQIGEGSLNESNTNVLTKLNINNYDSLSVYTGINYQVEIQTTIKPLFRFSKEAKLHPQWHQLLIDKFIEAYSFEEFEKRIAQ